MNQFTKGVYLQCEFREWDGKNRHGNVCSDEAKRYKRKDGKRFDMIKGGEIKKESKRMMRLCEYHYKEITSLIELEEAKGE
jgi:hypothetical protein